jgi:hypothetical protein
LLEWETIVINRVGVFRPLLGAAVIASAWLAWSRSPAAQSGQPGQAEALPSPQNGASYVGVASCSSMACHHFNGAKGSARSEYSTWAGFDKHARAYAVLEDPRSDRIVKNLYGTGPGSATKTELCLKCHATFTGADMVKGDRFYLGDGVGCESCHGPAGNTYLTTHYLAGFKEQTPEQKEAAGMRNTKNLVKRAQLCTTCHVGDETKEVNHDLIAAGHPRLNFELAGYHGIAQKHWSHADELARHRDFEARLWLVGQLSSARAALKLLAVRAESAEKDGKGRRPWPEFAEYDCFACHRDLKVLNYKEDLDYQKAKYGRRYAGTFPYGTWYLSMLPTMTQTQGNGADSILKEINAVRGSMEKPSPVSTDVARTARASVETIDKLLAQLQSRGPLDAAQARRYLKTVLDDGIKRAGGMDWDEATQLYLSLAAMYQALGDFGARPLGPSKMRDDFLAIKKQLRDAFPKGSDSPGLFNPMQPPLADRLKSIREQLD